MSRISFYRVARQYPEPLPSGEITIVSPPPTSATRQTSLFMTLFIGLLGIAGSLVMGLTHQSMTMTLITGITGGVSLLTSFIQWSEQRKSHSDQVRSAKAKYLNYLKQQQEKLQHIADKQHRFYATLYPLRDQLPSLLQGQERIWERSRTDEDFLFIPIGRGPVPLCTKVKMEESNNPFLDHDPNLLRKAHQLVEQYQTISPAPVVLPLKFLSSLAIRGPRLRVYELIRSMLLQVAIFHAPDDVRILAYFTPESTGEWQWLKWLPHNRRPRTNQKGVTSICCLVDNPVDFLALFNEEIAPKIRKIKKQREEKSFARADQSGDPHQLLVVDGIDINTLSMQSSEFAEMIQHGAEYGITILSLGDNRLQVPSSFSARLYVTEEGGFAYEEMTFGGQRLEGPDADSVDVTRAEELSRKLAPLVQSENSQAVSLADTVRLLDLMHVESPLHVDPLVSWQGKQRELVLRVPFGLRVDGQPVVLDLKEAADGGMGPHGLIIGATGSGKSELMRTIVTALAVENDPDTLSFIFVDFKGGAAFADLANLPHSAGMITNLEGDSSMIDRFYQSLLGEVDRRQHLLREAGNLDNIKQYQQKRQSRPYMEPLPYLVLIVDEFGELLAAQPDFTDLFVKIGRIGRSIGIHLLFATQRLEEGRLKGLETHLRYRICLRTFSEGESSTVIGTPDAYYLPSYPGVGYFKVDTHIYDLFKTASISQPYVAAAQEVKSGPVFQEFTSTGKLVDLLAATGGSTAVLTPPKKQSSEQRTEMELVIQSLAQKMKLRDAEVHQVWVSPLERSITLQDIFQSERFLQDLFRSGNYPYFNGTEWPARPAAKLLKIPIGIVDKPLIQAQEPLLLDFLGKHGHLAIVGAPQTGKSMMLRTIITSFLLTHKPTDVQIYAIDLGGGTLRTLENAPHVGTIFGKTDKDKFQQMIRQVRGIILEREHFFLSHRLDSMDDYRARRAVGEFADAPYGDVFLMIDDLAQLQAELFETVEQELTEIAATGMNYGVHLIVTASRWNDIRTKLRDNIGGRLELRVNDPSDSDIGRKFQLTLARDVAGRGLIREGLQFQTALPRFDSYGTDPELALPQALEHLVQSVQRAWQGKPAQPIRILPLLVRAEEVANRSSAHQRGIPFGIEESQLDLFHLDLMGADPHFLIYGDSESGKTNALRAFMHGLTQRYSPDQAQVILVDYRRTLHEFMQDPQFAPYCMNYIWNAGMANDVVMNLRMQLDMRVPNASTPNPSMVADWTGPHYFLLIDDFEMVATQVGNPFSMLTDFLLQSRDIGLHVLVARRVGGASRSFDPFIQRLKEMGVPGLIMNGDPQEGPLISTQRAETLPPGRGYLVRRNQKSLLVQTLFLEG